MTLALPDCDPERPVLLSGCTASGKSALALELAERQGRSIVNADALQVYNGWRILTARPSDEELGRATHLLYGHVDYRDSYSVGDWLRDVAPYLKAQPAPIIIGGTGLYFQALLSGLADIPTTDPEIRSEATATLADVGLAAMTAQLDPTTRARIDVLNPMRVQRAWEVLRQTGRGLASWQDSTGEPLLKEEMADCFVLWSDRDALNARIDMRFDQMMTSGALEEAKKMEPDWDPDRQSSRAIGARELIGVLRNELPINEAIVSAKQATRQYAKRQRTWMRSKMGNWLPLKLNH